jgi:hypothetical protein
MVFSLYMVLHYSLIKVENVGLHTLHYRPTNQKAGEGGHLSR